MAIINYVGDESAIPCLQDAKEGKKNSSGNFYKDTFEWGNLCLDMKEFSLKSFFPEKPGKVCKDPRSNLWLRK